MKTNTDIIPGKLDEAIGYPLDRAIINRWMLILRSYYKIQINYNMEYQQHYINAILHSVDFLYQYYDLNSIYFSLLDHAIRTLEKLVSTDAQGEMLAEYCDKTAVVFQTAADKTRQDPIYKEIWSNKAKEYKRKADTIRGIVPDAPHEDRIMHLYRTFAESMTHEFIRNLLMDNYRRYESRYRVSEPQSDGSGLRHRRHGETQNDGRNPLLSDFYRGRSEEVESRIRTAQRLCEAGNARGQYEMAVRHRYGWGVPQDPRQALDLYKMAAERGQDAHAGACYELTRLYLQGNILMGIEKNIAIARYYARLGTNADPYAYNYSEYHGSATADYDQRRYIEESANLLRVIDGSELAVSIVLCK